MAERESDTEATERSAEPGHGPQTLAQLQGTGAEVVGSDGGVPVPEASDRASLLQRLVSALGSANVVLFAGLIAESTVFSEEGVPPTRVGTRS